MIPNDRTKEAVNSRLRSYATLTSRLPDGIQGVREINWRGADFKYPNVRIQMGSQYDATPETNCTPTFQPFDIFVFSEMHSSQECDEIAGIVEAYLRGSTFTVNNVKFSNIKILELVPAIQDDPHTWRAQVRCQSTVYLV